MKWKLKINQLVPVGFGAIVALTIATNLMSKSTTNTLVDAVGWVTHTYSVKGQLKELEKLLVDAETGQRGFLFTGKEEFLEPYFASSKVLKNKFSELRNTIKDNPTQIKRLEAVEDLAQQKMDELATTISLKKANKEQELRTLVLSGKGKQIMDDLRRQLVEIVQVEEKLLEERQKTATQAEDLANYSAWLSVAAVIVVGAIVSFLVASVIKRALSSAAGVAEQVSEGNLTTRIEVNSDDDIGKLLAALKNMTQNLNSLIRQVQHSGIQVTTSSTQIAASGKQLEATMSEQVAATNQVVATAKEIAATAGELVHTMETVTTMVQSTTTSASGSQQDLSRMESTMRQLAEATDSISTKLGVMSEKANNINNVVTTITKVADQTNLLSLNAAIEAEKAGEYGMGFAVVAREIRRLADQTAVATLDIEQMVKEMQSAVSTGVMEMDKFTREVDRGVEDVRGISSQIAQVIVQVQSLAPQFEAVNQGMESQSQGAQQISQAMVQLSESSQQTAISLRETNGAIEQLHEAAQNLRREISGFKVSTDELSTKAV